jgi:hypothetical protein
MREVLLIDRVVQVLKRHRELTFGKAMPEHWHDLLLFQTVKGTKIDQGDED